MDAIVYDKVGKEAEKVREALYGIYPQETITDAAIASFDDGADGIPVKALTVGIEPVQDLHGYDHPWPAGGGKNLCDPSKKTVDSIGDVRYYASDGFTLKAGVTYTFSITDVTIAPNGLYVVKQSDFSSLKSAYNVTAITYTPSEDVVAAFRCLWNQNPTESMYANIKAQLEIGSSASAYSPYSNICPISGWTGANIFNEVEYDAEATPKLSISWESEAGTVYGGEDEVISGKLKKTMGMVDLGTLNWTYSGGRFIAYLPLVKQAASNFTPVNAICSIYPVSPIANTTSSDYDKIFGISIYRDLAIRDTSYTDPMIFKSAMSGVQLVYELANPVEYDLTPQTLDTFYGQNNIWADTGNVKKLTYRADLGKYIDSHITTAVADALNA